MTERPLLYACSSYYQLYVSLIRALVLDQRIDLILEEHGIATAAALKQRLGSGPDGRIGNIYVCPDDPRVDPYRQRCASFIPWQRREILRHMERVLDGADSVSRYGGIHVFWDLGYTGTYLNIRRISYTLHEDSLNSYRNIRANRPHYAYLFDQKGWKFRLKKRFHIGVLPFGYSDMCTAVEVNDAQGLDIPLDKVTAVPEAALTARLTAAQRRYIFDVFMADAGRLPALQGGALLLLTEPFAATGRLPDRETQVRLYRDVLARFGAGRPVLIKPHPRDDLDYRRLFPDAAVMEKNLPTEILDFDPDIRFSAAVTVTSSAIQGISRADEKLSLGPEFLHTYASRGKGAIK